MDGEKQVRVPKLDTMTVQELQELLNRQEKLLSIPHVLKTLPDRGQKVKEFAAKLQNMISQRQESCSTQNQSPHPVSTHQQPSDRNGCTDSVTHVQSAADSCDSAISDKSFPESKNDPEGSGEGVDGTAALSNAMDSLVLGELAAPRTLDKSEDGPRLWGHSEAEYPNTYEKIIKRNESPSTKKTPFKPYSNLKIKDIDQLPDKYKCKSRSTGCGSSADVTTDQPSDSPSVDRKIEGRVHVQEESAVSGPKYKFTKGAKYIGLQESLHLQQKQWENSEKIQMLHAAERLAERLNIKTVDYNPPTVDMQYRSNSSAADDGDTYDSDDDADYADDLPD